MTKNDLMAIIPVGSQTRKCTWSRALIDKKETTNRWRAREFLKMQDFFGDYMPVFHMKLKALRAQTSGQSRVRGVFVDAETGGHYESDAKSMVSILKCITEGHLAIKDGFIQGLFTFGKHGDHITIKPAHGVKWK